LQFLVLGGGNDGETKSGSGRRGDSLRYSHIARHHTCKCSVRHACVSSLRSMARIRHRRRPDNGLTSTDGSCSIRIHALNRTNISSSLDDDDALLLTKHGQPHYKYSNRTDNVPSQGYCMFLSSTHLVERGAKLTQDGTNRATVAIK
jgi:hypothetical protein